MKIKNSKTHNSSPYQYLLWILFIISSSLAFRYFLKGDEILTLCSFDLGGLKSNLSLKIDAISVLMSCMISLLGLLISMYSLRYLNGERNQNYFYQYLTLALFSVFLMVLSNHLIVFFLMWLASSFALHKLLLFSPERNMAQEAAWKKFWVSRIGDISLFFAILLTYKTFKTFEFSELFELIKTFSSDSFEIKQLALVSVFFVIGAMIKSAQFPFHFWLPETMETPAPVSALMHAGIINAGGFLIIRLSPILSHGEIAHLILTLVGSITAVFGSLVMITQNDIKKKLAYSTISQMGIMMVACGLGAYSIALFHIVAHSFYKSHAFLSTGVLIEESKKIEFQHFQPSLKFIFLTALMGLVIILLGFLYSQSEWIAYFTYSAILMLGFVQNIDFDFKHFSKMGGKFFLVLSSSLAFSLCICILGESILHAKLTQITPLSGQEGNVSSFLIISCFLSYLIFVVGLVISSMLIETKSIFLKKIYFYFWNGGYFLEKTQFINKPKLSFYFKKPSQTFEPGILKGRKNS